MRITKRKILTGTLAAGVLAGGVSASVMPASADECRIAVTLVTGRTIVVTADIPPGTPLSSVTLPGIPASSVAGLSEIGCTSSAPQGTTTSPSSTPTQTQTQPQGTTTSPSTTPKPGGGSAPKPAPNRPGKPQRQRQRQTGGKPKHPKGKPGVGGAGGGVPAPLPRARTRGAGGAPTPANPTFSLALPGPAPIGVPDFFIDKFRVPPFLLSIYQAAGTQYGVPWEILAAINEIETDYGRNLSVSTAGAVGWMQFLPSTWQTYGVDANHDGVKDPYNPVDAIFAAARYLKAAGADKNLRQAIFGYNHADWYVDSVLLRAKLLGGLPADFVGSLTGLTEGRFPVAAKSTYADDVVEAQAQHRIAKSQNAAIPVESDLQRHSIDIFSRQGAPVIAVQDGKVLSIGANKRLGRFLKLRDAYGNTYTYAHLGSVARMYPVPKPQKESAKQIQRELKLPTADPKPEQAATAGRQVSPAAVRAVKPAPAPRAAPRPKPIVSDKERLFAHPSRPAALEAGGREQIANAGADVTQTVTNIKDYLSGVYGIHSKDVVLKRLRPGAQVIGGTILGRVGQVDKQAPHMTFYIRPAGKGAPMIDPKPLLDGWQLLESTAIYRASGRNPFTGPNPSIGQILLMGKDQLEQRVLNDPRIQIYQCGRHDIETGFIDRRVLAMLEFLATSGLKPTVSSLHCGHSYLVAGSTNVSEHSTGDAADIAAVNGIPILGHQGPGSITDITIRRLLTLQGIMKPHQIISLMSFPGTDNTLVLPDHYDHIHVGYHPAYGQGGAKFDSVLKPGQWVKLIDRLGSIAEPTVPTSPSKYAIRDSSAAAQPRPPVAAAPAGRRVRAHPGR